MNYFQYNENKYGRKKGESSRAAFEVIDFIGAPPPVRPPPQQQPPFPTPLTRARYDELDDLYYV